VSPPALRAIGVSALRIKRVYEPAAAGDGVRVLVDRLWPRGLKRDTARIDQWLKAVAPSEELRRWFNHDPERWVEFRKRYRAELARNRQSLTPLRDMLKGRKPVTLLFAARDAAHNNAVVLQAYLTGRRSRQSSAKTAHQPQG
jgi:uncharacterized protein YeaO (DUF488 family)